MEISKGYKQTDIGIIPSDWEVKPLDKEIDLLTGFPFPSNKYSEAGIRLLRGSNVKRGETDWSENITQYWEQLTPELKMYLLQEGDIVIAMDGSLVGRSFARLSKTDLPALLLQRVVRVRSNKVELGYLKEFICSDYFTKYCDSVKTVSAIPHISPGDIRNFKIPLPPTKAEQTAIAKALSDADALISSLEKLIEKKRNIKQGTMQQLLKPKKGWVVKKFKDKDVTNLITCGIAATPEYVSEFSGYPFLSSTNVKDGKIVWSNYKHIGKELHSMLYRNNPPQRGDILYSRVGTIGEAAIVEVDFEFSVYVSLTLIKTGKLILNEYLKHLLNSDHYKKLAQSTVLMGGGVGNLNVNVVREWDIPVPPNNEQKEIATILSDMDNEITTLEKKLSKHKMLKQGMMQELLTGKIRLV